MKEYTLFARRIGLVGFSQTFTSLRGIITLPILTKILGTTGYGILAQILVTISLLMPFITLGLGASLVRFLPSKNNKEIVQGILTALSVVFLSGIFFSLLLFFSSSLMADIIIKDTSAIPVIQIASLLIIIQSMEMIATNSFRIFGQIKRYSIITISKTLLEICLIAGFVLGGYGVFGVILALTITESIFLITVILLMISHAGFALPNFSLIRPFLAFGLPLIPLGIFEIIVSSCDRYVIGFFKGASSVGIYSAAYNLGIITYMVGPFIIFILSPTLANLYDKGKMDAVKTHLSYSLKYFLMLSIPSAFGLSVLTRPLLSILTTSEFMLTGMDIYIIPLVASGIIFYGVYAIFGEVLKLSKQTKTFAIVMAIAGVTNLGLNFIAVPYWGILGAAITTLLSYAIAAGIIYYKSRKYIKFDIKFASIIKSIISAGAMMLIIWILKPGDILTVLLSIVIGIIVYFSILFILKGFGKGELKTIAKAIGMEKLYDKIIRHAKHQ